MWKYAPAVAEVLMAAFWLRTAWQMWVDMPAREFQRTYYQFALFACAIMAANALVWAYQFSR